MTTEKRTELFKSICNYFSEEIKNILLLMPQKAINDISEIRLRSGRPLSATVGGESIFISKTGQICHLMQHGLYIVTKKDMDLTFRNLCEFSEYAYKDQLKMGYLPLKNGCRAGIAARTVLENGKIAGLTGISSINLRIAAEYINCALPLSKAFTGGLLIAGPPGSGKTTLLRDSVRLISCGIGTERKRVVVIDSRGEIASVKDGIPQNDVGILTDVITGCSKAEGIEMAVRTLNPQVIAFDEISSESEAKTVVDSMFSGVEAVMTVHAGSPEEILKHKASRIILESGAVKNAVFISKVGAKPMLCDLKGEYL